MLIYLMVRRVILKLGRQEKVIIIEDKESLYTMIFLIQTGNKTIYHKCGTWV